MPPVRAAAAQVIAKGNGSYLVTIPIDLGEVAGLTTDHLWCEGLTPSNAAFTPAIADNCLWGVTTMSLLPAGRIPKKLNLVFQIYACPISAQAPKGTLRFSLFILGMRDAGFRFQGNIENLSCCYEVDLSKGAPSTRDPAGALP
jgi:hypothetical protein